MAGRALDALLLAGPTASGKSAWALELARRWPVEIVSVDSAQVYRGLDIGTAKPGAALRAEVPHHLIDIRDPAEPYSAGEFVADALRAIEAIRTRGRLPVLVGGTMLYFRAFTAGIARLPVRDEALRRQIDAEAAVYGWPALHARLASVDPQAAMRIAPQDAQRIQRALEVHAATGRPISQWRAGTAAAHELQLARWALLPSDRGRLHARIAERFEAMMAQGFLAEVEALLRRGDLSPLTPSMRSVGYRQLRDHLEGRTSLPAAVAAGIAATRQLAKRQYTWIRSDPGWDLVDPFASQALEKWLDEAISRLSPRS